MLLVAEANPPPWTVARVMRVIDEPRYRQRSMCETVLSSIKRTIGDAVRARTWYKVSFVNSL